jgi:regulator of extracellular matrix RemA (YlzA/DUF370 family)
LTTSGISIPSIEYRVGTMSTACTYCRRTRAEVIRAGHETIIGSAVPPSKFEYRFHSLNGVLKAHAHPVG